MSNTFFERTNIKKQSFTLANFLFFSTLLHSDHQNRMSECQVQVKKTRNEVLHKLIFPLLSHYCSLSTNAEEDVNFKKIRSIGTVLEHFVHHVDEACSVTLCTFDTLFYRLLTELEILDCEYECWKKYNKSPTLFALVSF